MQKKVELSKIIESPLNPRGKVTKASVKELAKSIKEKGLLQPIKITPIPGTENYSLIFGHRRLKAHEVLGLDKIDAFIEERELSDSDILEIQIVENLQREDVDVIEESKSIKKLMNMGFTESDIAIKLGRSRSFVSNRLSLLNSDKDIIKAFKENKITLSVLYYISKLNISFQKSVIKEYTYDDELKIPTNVNVIKEYIESKSPELSKFPWDLDREFGKNGACSKCPNTTCKIKDLFGKVEDERCLNKDCYTGKLYISITEIIDKLLDEGENVILQINAYWISEEKLKESIIYEKYGDTIIYETRYEEAINKIPSAGKYSIVKEFDFSVEERIVKQITGKRRKSTSVSGDETFDLVVDLKDKIKRSEERKNRKDELDYDKIIKSSQEQILHNNADENLFDKLNKKNEESIFYYSIFSQIDYNLQQLILDKIEFTDIRPYDMNIESIQKILDSDHKRNFIGLVKRGLSLTVFDKSYEMLEDSDGYFALSTIATNINKRKFNRIVTEKMIEKQERELKFNKKISRLKEKLEKAKKDMKEVVNTYVSENNTEEE